MVRPKRMRRVWCEPKTNYFKPVGIPMKRLEEVNLTLDEFEAIRLADVENNTQIEAAKKINVSQPTFCRLIDTAYKKIADAIVNGKAIKVEGGNYSFIRRRGRRFSRRV